MLIVEGLNVLQGPVVRADRGTGMAVSDFFDFSVYVDARTSDLQQWYVERFLRLRETAFADPTSYFHRYAALDDVQARETAGRIIWREINGPNLAENILPTRSRASLVLTKGENHTVRRVRLRKSDGADREPHLLLLFARRAGGDCPAHAAKSGNKWVFSRVRLSTS